MRSLSEIQQANKEFEERDKRGDFDEEDDVNRCRACREEVEDCTCNRELGGGTIQDA